MNEVLVRPFAIAQAAAGRCETDAGYAVVATVDGEVMDFAYMRNLVPELNADGAGDGNWPRVVAALQDERCAGTLQQLQSCGDVHVGVLYSNGFYPLKRWA